MGASTARALSNAHKIIAIGPLWPTLTRFPRARWGYVHLFWKGIHISSTLEENPKKIARTVFEIGAFLRKLKQPIFGDFPFLKTMDKVLYSTGEIRKCRFGLVWV